MKFIELFNYMLIVNFIFKNNKFFYQNDSNTKYSITIRNSSVFNIIKVLVIKLYFNYFMHCLLFRYNFEYQTIKPIIELLLLNMNTK